jgi:DNA-binding NarL/FixJ family response regulator
MRCLIIDRVPVYLMGMKRLLEESFPSWTFLTAGSLPEAGRYFSEILPDLIKLIVIDSQLCLAGDAAFINFGRILAAGGPVAVLVGDSAKFATTAATLNAKAFVLRDELPDEMVRTVKDVIATAHHFGESRSRLWLVADNTLPPLTDRQRDVLELLKAGCSNKQIAAVLNLSCGTVKNYVFALMRRVNVRSRLQLVSKAEARPHAERIELIRRLPNS